MKQQCHIISAGIGDASAARAEVATCNWNSTEFSDTFISARSSVPRSHDHTVRSHCNCHSGSVSILTDFLT